MQNSQITKIETIEALKDFDSLVDQTLREFQVPGISIGVIVDDKVILSRGYGVRDNKSSLMVTNNTFFPIGSCTKSFTAFLAGLLADEGKLDLDQPITTYLPGFKLKNNEIAKKITMVDLLSHRTGMPGHDYVWYRKPELSRKEIVERLQFLDFSEELRHKFRYNNMMYAATGIVTENITGNTWEEDVKQKILNPLDMTQSNFSVEQIKLENNFALPHAKRNGSVQEIPFYNISNIGPAGSINSNVIEMLHWIEMLLNSGNYKGNQLIQSETLTNIFTPRIPVPDLFIEEDRKLLGYCLGWGLSMYQGHRILTHDGGIDGFRSKVTLLPDHKIGFVILTNSEDGAYATNVLGRTLVDRLLNIQGKEWLTEFKNLQHQTEMAERTMVENFQLSKKKDTSPSHKINEYVGQYIHPAYGILDITYELTHLKTVFSHINIPMEHFHYDVFIGKADEDPHLQRLQFQFRSNFAGNIDSVALIFEPMADPIIFNRTL